MYIYNALRPLLFTGINLADFKRVDLVSINFDFLITTLYLKIYDEFIILVGTIFSENGAIPQFC